jgi:hypothetical protein
VLPEILEQLALRVFKVLLVPREYRVPKER